MMMASDYLGQRVWAGLDAGRRHMLLSAPQDGTQDFYLSMLVGVPVPCVRVLRRIARLSARRGGVR